MAGPFGWCSVENRHSHCPGEYKRFQIDTKTNKVVWSDEIVTCECAKRTCACYVKRVDRTKTTTRKRRKK